jgi:hypothetical protein
VWLAAAKAVVAETPVAGMANAATVVASAISFFTIPPV